MLGGDATAGGIIAKRIVAKRDFVPERCVVAEQGAVAKRWVIFKRGVIAKHGVVADQGVVAERGVFAKQGVVAKRCIVDVVAVYGVTTKQHFVSVGSTDPTFVLLPNAPVNKDLRFLPALMSVDCEKTSIYNAKHMTMFC